MNSGAWIDFQFQASDWYSAFNDFINTKPDLFTQYGDAQVPFLFTEEYDSQSDTSAPKLIGAPSMNDPASLAVSGFLANVLQSQTNTIDFVTSEGVGVDLVQDLFGGSKTAISCGIAYWPSTAN